MHFIEAVLAFALIMIALSTVCSGFSETINRVWGLRKNNLRAMVRSFIAEIIWPHYSSANANAATDEASKRLLDDLTRNRLSTIKPWGLNWNSHPWVDELSTQGFLERFAKTPEGQFYYRQPQSKALIIDFSLSYDRHIATARELYRKTSQKVVFVVAIGLALVANIHLGRLIDHLGNDPDVVSQILENEEQVLGLYTEDDADEDARREAIRAELDRLVGLSEDLKLPFGWEHWPHCTIEWFQTETPDGGQDASSTDNALDPCSPVDPEDESNPVNPERESSPANPEPCKSGGRDRSLLRGPRLFQNCGGKLRENVWAVARQHSRSRCSDRPRRALLVSLRQAAGQPARLRLWRDGQRIRWHRSDCP